MRTSARLQSLVAVLFLATAATPAGLRADQPVLPETSTNRPAELPSAASDDARRLLETSLKLQQQLQENLTASERARTEAAAASRTNAEALAAQLRALEKSVADRQESRTKSLEKTAGSLLLALVLCAVAGLVALLVFVWAQLRGMNRLAGAVIEARQMDLAHPPSQPLLAESASLQLFGALDRLEKRIGELEHSSPAALLNPDDGAVWSPLAAAGGGGSPGPSPSLRALIGKGQVLMNLGKHEEALACYEKALAEDPNHIDGLMKKAAALERLVRLEEALVCYDTALAIRPGFTQAQLAKASVLNQLERFTEALNCFEAAIEHQRASA